MFYSSSQKYHKTETVIHRIVMTDRILSKFIAYEQQICTWTDNYVDSKLDQVPSNEKQMCDDYQGSTGFNRAMRKSTMRQSNFFFFFLRVVMVIFTPHQRKKPKSNKN